VFTKGGGEKKRRKGGGEKSFPSAFFVAPQELKIGSCPLLSTYNIKKRKKKKGKKEREEGQDPIFCSC